MSEPSTLRVEIADAGGTEVEVPTRIAEALRALAIEAFVVPLETIVHTRADAVILRGDAAGVLAIVRALRDDGARPDTPVLLLGTPEGTGPFQEGPGFGAEHVLVKDASATRIAEVLRRITRKTPPSDPSRERRVELTMELAQKSELGAGEWRTQSGDRDLAPPALEDEPPGVVRKDLHEDSEPPDAGEPGESRQVSEIIASPASESQLSAVFDNVEGARRRPGSSPGDRRDSVAPGTGSHPGSSPGSGVGGSSGPGTSGTGSGVASSAGSVGTGSVPSTSQLFVVASISDALRKVLYDADRRVFPERPPIDVSIPRGEDAARDLVPDDFLEVLSLSVDEPERADLELTFVGAAGARADDTPRARLAAERVEPTPAREEARDDSDENRPKTSPGTPTSMSKRPPEPEGSTRSSADAQLVPPRPYVGQNVGDALAAASRDSGREDVAVRPSQPPPRVALVSSERGELAPLGALALLGQLALGRLDVVLTLRVEDKPVVLSLARGELVHAHGEGYLELRRRMLHRVLSASLGAGQATDVSRAEPTFALERASRLAEESVLAEVLVKARGGFALEPRVIDPRAESSPRLTQRSLLAMLLELARRGLGTDRVIAHFLPGPEDPTISRFERLSRLEVSRAPNLERVLDAMEAPRELAWLVRHETASSSTTMASLLAAAPDEPGLVGAVFAVAQLGGLTITTLEAASTLAHTDLDARAERAITSLRDRADRADYFEVLGIPKDSDGSAVVEAHYRLRAELLAWPLADLGLARLEADRTRILAVLDDAADVLADSRQRRRYAKGLGAGGLEAPPG
ncbi:MAG: hypothetical protein J0L92_33125 [Deltaproteobacteria bacterium]|nr:hypothetical protein [Deltaproteobacteria bacterium]